MVDHANNGEHYDQLIAADNEKGNQIVRDSTPPWSSRPVRSKPLPAKLGISDLNPDSADHEFDQAQLKEATCGSPFLCAQ